MRGRQWTREPPEKYEWGVAVVSKRRAVHGGGREGREGREAREGRKEGRKGEEEQHKMVRNFSQAGKTLM